jgi:hypothetical protein
MAIDSKKFSVGVKFYLAYLSCIAVFGMINSSLAANVLTVVVGSSSIRLMKFDLGDSVLKKSGRWYCGMD